jgi:uncharacterized membrane protein YraQ (UPF0718 family)
MPITEPSALGDFFFAFLSILLEGAPYIVLGTLVSGLIDAYLPSGAMDKLLPKNRPLAIFISGLLGSIFPVCECAVVPVIRRLVKKGLPVSCAITYMLAAPIINPITVLSTWSAFRGGEPPEDSLFMVLSRLLIAYIVTVGVGLIVQRFSARAILRPHLAKEVEDLEKADSHTHDHKHSHDHDHKHTEDCGHDHSHDHSHAPAADGSKLVAALRTAQRDFLDTGMYFTIGIMITALFNTQINKSGLDGIASSDWAGVPAMMVLAFILSLCSTSDAFIAAALQQFSTAAKLAFLIFGPMVDVKLIFMYSAVFRSKFVIWLTVGLFVTIGILCTVWVKLATN